jgi:S1-C subfamily serine protease
VRVCPSSEKQPLAAAESKEQAMDERKRPDVFWKAFSVVLLVVLIGLVGLLYAQQAKPKYVYYDSSSGPKSSLAALSKGMELDHSSIYWVADLADKALPFVVNIQTSAKASANQDGNSDEQQQLMQQMQQMMPPGMGQQFQFRQYPQQRTTPRQQQNKDGDSEQPVGEGSGFIIREDGYIVTNAHVVDHADKFKVRTSGGKEYDAKLVGTDNFKDIAVLKIESNDKFPVATLGDSSTTRIGEPVVAIGSPLGLQASVTSGILSTNQRSATDVGRAKDVRIPQTYLQTDAAINRGNSGGPLLNAKGEIIGINEAIARWDNNPALTEGGMVPVEGIGFAIPINAVKDTITQIVQKGKVVYPGISAEITSVDDFLKTEPNVKLSVKSGVYVSNVVVDGPAARAGIEAGDVILSIDGKAVATASELIDEIDRHDVGDRVKLRVARQGGDKQEDVSVVLGELDLANISPGE